MDKKMANKKLRVGSLIVSKTTRDGTPMVDNLGRPKTLVSLALGNKNPKAPQYDLNVEVIVTDSTGKVVHKQKNGFLPLTDPRTQPDDLLAAGLISEEIADKMKTNVAKLPEKIKYTIEVPTK